MQNRVYSVLLGDLSEDAMRRHIEDDAIDLYRARQLIMLVSGSCLVVAAALFIWGVNL